jgi:hypothetical protein
LHPANIMAQLSPDQLSTVQAWAEAGATLNDIQSRLKSELSIQITYLEARVLMTELQVRIKDKPREPVKVEAPAAPAPAATELPTDAHSAASLNMTVDEVPLPGTLISGRATFSDGVTTQWFLDQMGRPGLRGTDPSYQPPPGDIPVFQSELDRVLVAAGL